MPSNTARTWSVILQDIPAEKSQVLARTHAQQGWNGKREIFPWVSTSIFNRLLIGGLEHEFYFSTIYGIILPIDELIFFKMIKTTNQFKPVFENDWPK